MDWKRRLATLAMLLLGGHARAQVLDAVLPASAVPGYGTPFGVAAARRDTAPGATVWGLDGVLLAPSLTAATGYDSAPDGAAGAALLTATPSLAIADPAAGFGAYATAGASLYPAARAQNTQSLALAAGERVQTAWQIITLSAAALRGALTGFALDDVALPTPLAYTLTDLRATDAITAGPLTLTPEVSATSFAFPDIAVQNHRDTRETLTLRGTPDGVLTAVMRLRATQSVYGEGGVDSATQSALAGVEDQQDGLWTLSALAGEAWRETAQGPPLSAPVLEAGADWMPDAWTRLRLTVAREIDDPDDISATPYTLTQAKLALTHGAPGCLMLTARVQAEQAAYWRGGLRETLLLNHLAAAWPLGPDMVLNTAYDYNSRQANRLQAANEQVITLGLTWTP